MIEGILGSIDKKEGDDGFPDVLHGSLWHTTTVERYEGIVRDGHILPEPDINSERWGTALGPDYFPFVRSIGGVSLFDFRNFNPKKYSERYPFSMWRTFVPCISKKEESIWIELNYKAIKSRFISGKKLVSQWKDSDSLGRKIMPIIEAAHIGPVPIAHFSKVLIYKKSTNMFSEYNDFPIRQKTHDGDMHS